jgi:uncharacterized protein YdaU (DUF1376 family)
MATFDEWMPLYVAEYIGDTGHLTYDQHGPYLLLLMHYWRKGPLPNDDAMLSAISRVPLDIWQSRIGPILRTFFTLADDGLLHQKRADAELAKRATISAERSAAGKRGSQKRWGKAKGRQEDSNCQAGDGNCYPVATVLPSYNRQRTEETEGTPEASLQGAARPHENWPTNLFGEEPKPSPKQLCYSEGVQLLSKLTKIELPAGRDRVKAQITRFLDQAGDDAAMVLDILRETAAEPPRKPVAWITACITSRTGRRPGAPEPAGPRLVVDANDPRGIKRWCQSAGFKPTLEADRETGGWYSPDGQCVIDQVARKVADVGRLPHAWTGDWSVLEGWLNEGFKPREIISLIENWARKEDYRPPATLMMFDSSIRRLRAA